MEVLPQHDSQTKAQMLFATSEEVTHEVEDLHSRLVEFDPDFTYDPSVERPIIEIVNDDEIAVEGRRMQLTRLDRFILNALRISQGYAQTSRDIFEAGFEGHISSIQPSITRLSAFLCEAAGSEIIAHESSPSARIPKSYLLLPEVEIIDTRSPQRTKKQFLVERYVTPSEDGTITDNDGLVLFASRNGRIKVTQQLLHDFRHLADGSVGQQGIYVAKTFSINSPESPLLTADEEAELLLLKEAALKVYVETGDGYTEAETQTILKGVHAFDRLLVAQTRSLRRIAGKYAADRTPFADLYQVGFEHLMNVVASAKPQQDGTPLNFRVAAHLSKSLVHYSIRETLSLTSFPKEVLPDLKKIREVFGVFAEQGKGQPDTQAIAEHTSLAPDRVRTILRLWREKEINDGMPDYYREAATANTDSPDRIFALEEERQSQLDAVTTVFESKSLKDAEKVVLSLYFGIFHAGLSGYELRHNTGDGTFVYPYTESDFEALLGKKFDLTFIESQLLCRAKGYASRRFLGGLRAARTVLVEDPLFDHSRFVRAEGFAQNQEERALIVEQALKLQPDSPIQHPQAAALAKDGLFFNPKIIQRVFGSMAEFHKACGFEVDMSTLLRSMSNEDIVALALKLQPDGPLRRGAIEKLAADNAFPDRGTLIRRFGSMGAFHEACGFKQQEPEYGSGSKEELVALALKLQPDGPLSSSQIEKLCNNGEFISVTGLKRRFGSMGAFHEACGFEANSAARYRSMNNEELVALALACDPKAEFTPADISALNEAGKLPRPGTIRSRFGSIAAFNKACGLTK